MTGKNKSVLIRWALMFVAGYCFFGVHGVGVAALFILFVEVFL